MALTKVYNTNGEQVGEIELNDELFNGPVNEAVLHEVIKKLSCKSKTRYTLYQNARNG